MKKIMIVVFVVMLMISATAFAASKLTLMVNGKKLNADVKVINGVSYVPLKAVAEALDSTVAFDQKKNQINITKKGATPTTPKPAAKTWTSGPLSFSNLQIIEDDYFSEGYINVTNKSGKNVSNFSFKIFYYNAANQLIGSSTGIVFSLPIGQTKKVDFLVNDNVLKFAYVKIQLESQY